MFKKFSFFSCLKFQYLFFFFFNFIKVTSSQNVLRFFSSFSSRSKEMIKKILKFFFPFKISMSFLSNLEQITSTAYQNRSQTLNDSITAKKKRSTTIKNRVIIPILSHPPPPFSTTSNPFFPYLERNINDENLGGKKKKKKSLKGRKEGRKVERKRRRGKKGERKMERL